LRINETLQRQQKHDHQVAKPRGYGRPFASGASPTFKGFHLKVPRATWAVKGYVTILAIAGKPPSLASE
jgi:hypothetical protein